MTIQEQRGLTIRTWVCHSCKGTTGPPCLLVLWQPQPQQPRCFPLASQTPQTTTLVYPEPSYHPWMCGLTRPTCFRHPAPHSTPSNIRCTPHCPLNCNTAGPKLQLLWLKSAAGAPRLNQTNTWPQTAIDHNTKNANLSCFTPGHAAAHPATCCLRQQPAVRLHPPCSHHHRAPPPPIPAAPTISKERPDMGQDLSRPMLFTTRPTRP